jgi:hypothetical protein
MNVYRAFLLSEHGKVFSPPHVLDVTTDEAAIEAAQKLLDGNDIEVWQGQRLITTLRREQR